MNPKLSIDNLVRQLTPPHKRQPNRLGILRAFTSRLKELFRSFNSWRDDIRMKINITSQVIILEGYLRKKFNEPISIKIVTFDDGLMPIGYEHEGMMQGVDYCPENPLMVPFADEMKAAFGDVDFIVYVPEGIDLELVRAEIEKYKKATATYKII